MLVKSRMCPLVKPTQGQLPLSFLYLYLVDFALLDFSRSASENSAHRGAVAAGNF
jgi:hypothetical protein